MSTTLVIGLATSGLAVVDALLRDGVAVRAVELRADLPEAERLRAAGVDLRLGPHGPASLEDVDLVVPSPGVPERAPLLVEAAARGIEIRSELEFGARRTDVPMLAVTGTNGKSTTTSLIAAMLAAAGRDAIACGNIGHPLTLAAEEGHDVLAVEASSFQLRFAPTFAPRVSVLLNLAPDHLDWHGSFAAYAAAKASIFANQRPDDVHVGNRDDPEAAARSATAPCRIAWFRSGPPASGEVGWEDDVLVARLDREERFPKLPEGGAAWREDLAAATAAALAFGLTAEAISRGARTMRRLPHRGERVALVGDVAFVDDSKATNVHAAVAAMRGRHHVVLVAGGMAKGVDLAPLRTVADGLDGVVAIGEAADELAELFTGLVPVRLAGDIEEAVGAAYALARPGGTVLLAPACASWDMFRDYGERGDRFAVAARALQEEVAVRGD